MCSRSSAFREGLLAAISDGRDLDVSFDNFPYYLRSINPLHRAYTSHFTFKLSMHASLTAFFSIVYEVRTFVKDS